MGRVEQGETIDERVFLKEYRQLMGRNKKTGLDYFPFDIDTFQDIKIRKLIKYQSGKAVTVYALLLCLIYKSGYYMRWDDELPFIISEQTGFEEAYISEVIKSCMVLGLFSKKLFDEYGIVTSRGIQERYLDICRQIKRKCDFTEFSLISSEEMPISSEEIPVSSEEMPINPEEIPQKKIKEKKENIPPSNPPDGGGEDLEEFSKKQKELEAKEAELRAKEQELLKLEAALKARKHAELPKIDFVSPEYVEIFTTWLEYKRERRESYKSDKSLRAAYSKLLQLSENDPQKAASIVQQSMANNWAGLFELKTERNGTNRNPYPSKQEANDYALHALQERMEQRRSGLQDELPKPF